MKELLEALSVAMIAEGAELANGGGRMSSHDAATASMLKGFGRALAKAAKDLQPSKPAKKTRKPVNPESTAFKHEQ